MKYPPKFVIHSLYEKSVVLTVPLDLFLLLTQHPGCTLGRERMARRTSSWPTLRRLAHLPQRIKLRRWTENQNLGSFGTVQ